MNRAMYRKVAKQHGVSHAEVRQEMQLAINAAYVKPNAAALAVPRKGVVPTTDEFIAFCACEIRPRPLNTKILQ